MSVPDSRFNVSASRCQALSRFTRTTKASGHWCDQVEGSVSTVHGMVLVSGYLDTESPVICFSWRPPSDPYLEFNAWQSDPVSWHAPVLARWACEFAEEAAIEYANRQEAAGA